MEARTLLKIGGGVLAAVTVVARAVADPRGYRSAPTRQIIARHDLGADGSPEYRQAGQPFVLGGDLFDIVSSDTGWSVMRSMGQICVWPPQTPSNAPQAWEFAVGQLPPGRWVQLTAASRPLPIEVFLDGRGATTFRWLRTAEEKS